jgi:hypothetical protein
MTWLGFHESPGSRFPMTGAGSLPRLRARMRKARSWSPRSTSSTLKVIMYPDA